MNPVVDKMSAPVQVDPFVPTDVRRNEAQCTEIFDLNFFAFFLYYCPVLPPRKGEPLELSDNAGISIKSEGHGHKGDEAYTK